MPSLHGLYLCVDSSDQCAWARRRTVRITRVPEDANLTEGGIRDAPLLDTYGTADAPLHAVLGVTPGRFVRWLPVSTIDGAASPPRALDTEFHLVPVAIGATTTPIFELVPRCDPTSCLAQIGGVTVPEQATMCLVRRGTAAAEEEAARAGPDATGGLASLLTRRWAFQRYAGTATRARSDDAPSYWHLVGCQQQHQHAAAVEGDRCAVVGLAVVAGPPLQPPQIADVTPSPSPEAAGAAIPATPAVPHPQRPPGSSFLGVAADLRDAVVARGLARYLGTPPPLSAPSRLPRIAALLSGGGWRALQNGVNFFDALALHGMADCVHTVAGVSGGAWATTLTLMVNGGTSVFGTDPFAVGGSHAPPTPDVLPSAFAELYSTDRFVAARRATKAGRNPSFTSNLQRRIAKVTAAALHSDGFELGRVILSHTEHTLLYNFATLLHHQFVVASSGETALRARAPDGSQPLAFAAATAFTFRTPPGARYHTYGHPELWLAFDGYGSGGGGVQYLGSHGRRDLASLALLTRNPQLPLEGTYPVDVTGGRVMAMCGSGLAKHHHAAKKYDGEGFVGQLVERSSSSSAPHYADLQDAGMDCNLPFPLVCGRGIDGVGPADVALCMDSTRSRYPKQILRAMAKGYWQPTEGLTPEHPCLTSRFLAADQPSPPLSTTTTSRGHADAASPSSNLVEVRVFFPAVTDDDCDVAAIGSDVPRHDPILIVGMGDVTSDTMRTTRSPAELLAAREAVFTMMRSMDAALRDVLAGMASAQERGGQPNNATSSRKWWGDAVCWRYLKGRRIEVDVALPLPDPDTPLGDGATPPPVVVQADADAASDTSTAATYIDGPGVAPERHAHDESPAATWDGMPGKLAAAFSGGSRSFFRTLASAVEATTAAAGGRRNSTTSSPPPTPPPQDSDAAVPR